MSKDAPKKIGVDDFEFGDTLGAGAYGDVRFQQLACIS